jgi:hypothetical protein
LSFLSALFGGQNNTLSGDIGQTGNLAGFASSLGQKDLTSSSGFWQSILSGDSSKISQALAPAISSAKTSAQQQNTSTAEFGTRSGGTAASTAATNDKVHADITNLIGGLTGSAASNLASTGSGLLGTGLSAYGEQAGLSQQQMENWRQSLFGGAITGAVGIGLNYLGGKLGGAGDSIPGPDEQPQGPYSS